MNSNYPENGLLVLGMHRSGTSCLAGMLQLAGFDVGIVSQWDPDNRKGNRENSNFFKLNTSLLESAGGDWTLPVKVKKPTPSERKKYFEKLQQEFSDVGPWMLKDPRSLLTLDFWLEVLPNIRLIGIFRSPLSVAQSLSIRNAMPIINGLRLWTAYNKRLLNVVKMCNAPLLHFSHGTDFIQAAEQGLKELFPHEISEGTLLPDKMGKFFSDELIHHPSDSLQVTSKVWESFELPKNEISELEELWSELVGLSKNHPLKPGSRKPKDEQKPELTTLGDEEKLNQLLLKHEYLKSMSLLKQIVLTQPHRSDLWQKGIKIIQDHGEKSQLTDWVKQGLEYLPEDPVLLYHAALADWGLDLHAEAITKAEQVCELAPGWMAPVQILAQWYFSREEWHKSAKLFNLQQRISQNPKEKNHHFIQLFVDSGNGFNERESDRQPISLANKSQNVVFDLSTTEPIEKLRVDPANESVVIESPEFYLIDVDGGETKLSFTWTNATSRAKDIFFFDSRDPQFRFDKLQDIGKNKVGFRVKLDILDIGRLANSLKERINELAIQASVTQPKDKDQQAQSTSNGFVKRNLPRLPDIQLPPFIINWDMENISPKSDSSDQMLVSGWIVAKNEESIYLALKYAGMTRSYPLNVNRSDISLEFTEQGDRQTKKTLCGFSYTVPADSTIEIGVEHDMSLFWLYKFRT